MTGHRSIDVDLRASAARAVVLAGAATGALAFALQAALSLPPAFTAAALCIAPAGAFAILAHLPGRHPHARFGPANAVTLARAVPTALVAALVVVPFSTAAAWFAVAAGTLVAVLDGFDGALARKHGVASEFGARFDMETDSLLVLALAALAWRWDRAGAWVLLSGLARYLFVASAWVLPWMRRALPYSRRRQAVCVVQIVVLLAVAAPVLPRALSAPLAAAGLAVLAWSFLVDVAWLARRRGEPLPPEVSR